MDLISNMAEAKSFAKELGWTKVDGERALKGVDFPIDKTEALNQMVRFAGPELLQRQYLQRAQKTQVTKNKNKVNALEQELVETIEGYEQKITSDRSQFIAVIKYIYGFLNVFGFKDQWVDALIDTYDNHLNSEQTDSSSQNAA